MNNDMLEDLAEEWFMDHVPPRHEKPPARPALLFRYVGGYSMLRAQPPVRVKPPAAARRVEYRGAHP